MKKKGFLKGNKMACAVFLILLAIEIFSFCVILKANILPVKYFAVIVSVLVIVTILIALLIFVGKGKKSGGRIIAMILSVVLIICNSVGLFAFFKLDKTLDKITTNESSKKHIGVYVLKDDPAKTIEEAAKYKFGSANPKDNKESEKIISEINKKIGNKISVEGFDNPFSMLKALYEKKVQAVILDVAYLDVIEEIEGFNDFSSKVRLLWEYAVAEENNIPPAQNENSVSASKSIYDPFIIYLSGSDTRSDKIVRSRSDVNILAVVNPKTKQILLVNTPRDYYIQNPVGKGSLDKLTHCGIYGVECSMGALSHLYNSSVSYYVQINFNGFKTLVDSVGGITIYSDMDVKAPKEKFSIHKGENHLDGEQALYFARDRYSYADGDNARGRHQMQVITAIVKKMSEGAIITRYSKILDSLEGMFITNMPQDMIYKRIQMQIADGTKWNVLSYAVTGTGGKDYTYSMPGLRSYVTYPKKETVNHATQLIDRVMKGEVITQEDIG